MNNDRKPNKKDKNNRDPNDFFNRFFGDPFSRSSKDFFDLFEEHIRQMQDEIKSYDQQHPLHHDKGEYGSKPRIYGWSYYMGPDGKPHFQEFSNTDTMPSQNTPEISGDTEPFIDVIEGEKEIYVTVELPGVDKENIDVELTKDIFSLDVKQPERNFTKDVKLPAEVLKKPVEAKYNNGVLSITLKKSKQKKKGNKINID